MTNTIYNGKINKSKMQRYRRGHNGMDSKSIVRFVRPWVQIPPAAPQKACNQVDFRLFSFSQSFASSTKIIEISPLPASLLYLTNDFIPAIIANYEYTK